MAILTGMKAITGFLGLSEDTVLRQHRDVGLPIKKISGGIWQSTTEALEAFVRGEVEGGNNKREKKRR